MIKIFILILLTIICSLGFSNAQIIKNYGLKIGASLSEQNWNYSPQSGMDDSYISSIWGYDAGVFIEYFNMPYLSFISELHYIEKGRTLTLNGVVIDHSSPQGYRDIGPVKIRQRFSYLSIPILSKIQYDNPIIIPYLSVGPSIDLLILYPESEVYKEFNKVELGYKISGGINIPYGILSKLIMECSYSHSITDTYKNENVTVYNKGFTVVIGIVF